MWNGTGSGPRCLDDALGLLKLQVEWGADEAMEAFPVDRMPSARPKPAAAPRPVATPAAAKIATPRGAPAEQAVALAGQASTIEELRAALADFDGCALRDTASNLVFAEGDPASATLFIGEPPGREEDRGGHPFAGVEGQLLDQMLASLGMQRSALMLAPLVPWRPPGGRPVNATELALCLPFLHRLITLLQPQRAVLFGGTAARALLPPAASRRRTPRAWVELRAPGSTQGLPALALPSLGEMLKTPSLRRAAWAGLRLLRRAVDNTPAHR